MDHTYPTVLISQQSAPPMYVASITASCLPGVTFRRPRRNTWLATSDPAGEPHPRNH